MFSIYCIFDSQQRIMIKEMDIMNKGKTCLLGLKNEKFRK
jgi:hypothetical protein